MRAGFLAAALVLAAAPAIAADDRIEGEWCDARDGQRLIIDAYGVGFNEHTICEWVEGRPEGEAFDTVLSCANVYLNGDEVVRMDEQAVALSAGPEAPDVISAVFKDGERVDFARCEE